MTAIADPLLREIYDAIDHTVESEDAFFEALNARLEAADRMAQRIEWSIRDLSYKAPEQVLERALENLQALTAEAAAYRQSKEQP